MKIAIATHDFHEVASHAGKARQWLLYDVPAGANAATLPTPTRIELASDEVMHVFQDDRPHPLDGVVLIIAGSAGDGFVRHMQKRGSDVVQTGETDPQRALLCILDGSILPDTRFDITTALCKVRDLFSRH